MKVNVKIMSVVLSMHQSTCSFKFLDSNKEEEFEEALRKRFQNIYWCCDGDINKFCLMLWNSVSPYEHMGSWERFSETSLPEK